MQRLSTAVGGRRRPVGARGDSFLAQGAEAARIDEAAWGLAARTPELSAATGLWRWQKAALAGITAAIGFGAAHAPETTLAVLLAVMAIPFLFVVALRSAALWLLFTRADLAAEPAPVRVEMELMPLYTVLVPLYREAGVVPHLLKALAALDYPAPRLEIIFIVESVDGETQAALWATPLPPHMRVLVVPDGEPRTKPRAIQYALQFACGDYVVVYDAEDLPEPDQLRRALAGLIGSPRRLGCLQARLNIYNSHASWLTRQFTIEYTALFDCLLPTLERFDLPSLWAGPPTIFRAPCSTRSAAGTPHNVTEDADLGIRLARAGWHVGMLSSTTWEEAPPTLRIWLGQCMRWLKGWMQTFRLTKLSKLLNDIK